MMACSPLISYQFRRIIKMVSILRNIIILIRLIVFMAQEDQTFKIKEDENSDVRWIAVTDIDQKVTEEAMKVYYHQMVAKALSLKKVILLPSHLA